jgi:hypothetical protein
MEGISHMSIVGPTPGKTLKFRKITKESSKRSSALTFPKKGPKTQDLTWFARKARVSLYCFTAYPEWVRQQQQNASLHLMASLFCPLPVVTWDFNPKKSKQHCRHHSNSHRPGTASCFSTKRTSFLHSAQTRTLKEMR